MRSQFQSSEGWYVPDFSSGNPRPAVARAAATSDLPYRKFLFPIALLVVITMCRPFQMSKNEDVLQGANGEQLVSSHESMHYRATTGASTVHAVGGRADAEQRIQLRGVIEQSPSALDTDGDTKPGSVVTAHHAQWNISEPSHVQICRAILLSSSPPVAYGVPTLVTEHGPVCFEENAAAASLSQIFLSGYFAASARFSGVLIDYRHDCGQHRTSNHTLIQQLLPSTLTIPANLQLLKQEDLRINCQAIVSDMEDGGISNALDVLLKEMAPGSSMTSQGSGEGQSATSLLERLQTMIHANIKSAVQRTDQTEGVFRFQYGVLNRQHKKSDMVALDTATVRISCHDSECRDATVVPYMKYLLHLPLSIRTADVVVQAGCLEKVPRCKRYAEDLASTIRQFLPGISVELIPSIPASMDSFVRLVTAEHVVCGPGMNEDCVFASFGQGQTTRSIVTLLNSSSSTTTSKEAAQSRLQDLRVKQGSKPKLLSTFRDEKQVSEYAQLSPDSSTGDCRLLRGRVGQWVKDMEYAKQAQYRTPLRHYSGNAEKLFRKQVDRGGTGGLQYRPSTTYRWEETRYNTCDATLVSFEGTCGLLASMHARRILILGDSLSLQLAQSLWMWLSSEGESPLPKGTLEPNFRHTFTCPSAQGINGTSFEFVLQFIRNDKLIENDQPVSIDKGVGNCGANAFCYPWTAEYTSDPRRTVLLANTGAHIHSFDEFRQSVDDFLSTIDQLNRPEDVILFRTVVPGHWKCDRPGLMPFRSFAEYVNDEKFSRVKEQEEVYSWSQFSLYNAYAARQIHKRHRQTSTFPSRRSRMEVLDVFPTTVLRPDGHCSDEFRPDNYLSTDCLHYTLPGPIDWWSHLAFSHLLDIAKTEISTPHNS